MKGEEEDGGRRKRGGRKMEAGDEREELDTPNSISELIRTDLTERNKIK